MKIAPLVPVYSLTLLLSAALLFSVQPMFSKMVLPLLGGTPQVWNTAMLFFQLMLLGGYAYAHGTTRFLSIRAQAILHVVLLIVFTVVLPFAIPAGWEPPKQADPTLWQLSLMTATVGGPFFVLAGSAPMLQRWFSASGHKDSDNPYFLYGASNLGSMTALLAYPVLIEPFLNLAGQSHSWMLGYFTLIALTVISFVLIVRNPAANRTPARIKETGIDSAPITWRMRFRWLILAFIPSSLMLGVTTFITMDIASVPLLWILPLALYVGTFIIVFARKPLISLKTTTALQGIMMIALIVQHISFPLLNPYILIGIHMGVFFFSALTCHMELAHSRPHARHLTEFYLIMSIGGAIGGFFNAIIAPQFMVIPLEYGIALFLACLIRFSGEPGMGLKPATDKVKAAFKKDGVQALASGSAILFVIIACVIATLFSTPAPLILKGGSVIIALGLAWVLDRRWRFAALTALALTFFPLGYHWSGRNYDRTVHQDRNFFGILTIADTKDGQRILMNGTTNHGTQALDEKTRLVPISYYSTNSPLRDAFHLLDSRSTQHVGVIGLGVGVTACFKHQGRSFDYYEINPLVREIAENPGYFTFLKDCGSPYKIIMGDGRLTIAEQPDASYDLLIIDAFSSDNIPIHLLTLEALELYARKIKDDGILVVHISNRFLDLEPVLGMAQKEMKIPAVAKLSDGELIDGTEIKSEASHWVVLSRNEEYIKALTANGWTPPHQRDGVRLWTDDYSNIISVMGNRTLQQRAAVLKGKKAQDKAAKEADVTSSP